MTVGRPRGKLLPPTTASAPQKIPCPASLLAGLNTASGRGAVGGSAASRRRAPGHACGPASVRGRAGRGNGAEAARPGRAPRPAQTRGSPSPPARCAPGRSPGSHGFAPGCAGERPRACVRTRHPRNGLAGARRPQPVVRLCAVQLAKARESIPAASALFSAGEEDHVPARGCESDPSFLQRTGTLLTARA